MYSKKKVSMCQFGPTNQYLLATPIGNISFFACSRGVHNLDLCFTSMQNYTVREDVKLIAQLYPDNGYTHKAAKDVVCWLSAYFKDPSASNAGRPYICNLGTPGSWSELVRNYLMENIAPGEVISYRDLARLVKSPGAARGVGSVMARNPIPIIIPCHRVVKSDGTPGLYCRGEKDELKLWLLRHEGVKIVKP